MWMEKRDACVRYRRSCLGFLDVLYTISMFVAFCAFETIST